MSWRPTYCLQAMWGPCRRSYCICIGSRDCTDGSTRGNRPGWIFACRNAGSSPCGQAWINGVSRSSIPSTALSRRWLERLKRKWRASPSSNRPGIYIRVRHRNHEIGSRAWTFRYGRKLIISLLSEVSLSLTGELTLLHPLIVLTWAIKCRDLSARHASLMLAYLYIQRVKGCAHVTMNHCLMSNLVLWISNGRSDREVNKFVVKAQTGISFV